METLIENTLPFTLQEAIPQPEDFKWVHEWKTKLGGSNPSLWITDIRAMNNYIYSTPNPSATAMKLLVVGIILKWNNLTRELRDTLTIIFKVSINDLKTLLSLMAVHPEDIKGYEEYIEPKEENTFEVDDEPVDNTPAVQVSSINKGVSTSGYDASKKFCRLVVYDETYTPAARRHLYIGKKVSNTYNISIGGSMLANHTWYDEPLFENLQQAEEFIKNVNPNNISTVVKTMNFRYSITSKPIDLGYKDANGNPVTIKDLSDAVLVDTVCGPAYVQKKNKHCVEGLEVDDNKILTEDVDDNNLFPFTIKDIKDLYPHLVSKTYEECGNAFILPDGSYLLSGKEFNTHRAFIKEALDRLVGVELSEDEYDRKMITDNFTKFFNLIRVNDGSKKDVEDRTYFVIKGRPVTASQWNALKDFIDFILDNRYHTRTYFIQAFVNSCHKKWVLINDITSEEIIDDCKHALIAGHFEEAWAPQDVSFLQLCKDRNIHFNYDGNGKLTFNNYRDMLKALQVCFDKKISYHQNKNSITIDKKYLEDNKELLENLVDDDSLAYDCRGWILPSGQLVSTYNRPHYDKKNVKEEGAIRYNFGYERYIKLPKERPTEKQFNTLLALLDLFFIDKPLVGIRSTEMEINYENGNTFRSITVSPKEFTGDEVVKEIKRWYNVLQEKIVHLDNGKWQVQSEDGTKNLGTYNTKKEAEDRLRQVHYFKHMNEETKDKE